MINELKHKNIFITATIGITLLSFAYASVSYVHSYGKKIDPNSIRAFSVTGEGKVTAKPDIAVTNFTVISEGGTDINALLKDNADKINAITAFLKENKIKDEDIKTIEYNVNPRYTECTFSPQPYNTPIRYPTNVNQQVDVQPIQVCPPPKIVGYTIRQSTEVKIHDFAVIGNILSGVVQKGANSVSQLSFNIDKEKELRQTARDEAVKNAYEKAQQLAKIAGFRVGKIIDIQDGSSYPYYAKYDSMMPTYTPGGVAPSISAGSQEINVNVTIRYEME